jgi:hypothetical protein
MMRTERWQGRRAFAAAVMVVTFSSAPPAPGSAAGREAAPLRLAQAARNETLSITVAPTLAASPATQIPLPIGVGPAAAAPRNSFLRVRGLPPMVSLSEGYVIAPGAWSVPLNALASLQMIVPAGASGRSELSISLVGEDGAVLAQAVTALVVQPLPPPAPPVEARSAPPKQPPPAPRAPVLSPVDREASEKFIARAEAEIAQGNIAVARQFLLRAAQIGLARGALLLAATHDPRELARWGVQGVQPNVAEARKWYERARELGAPEAEGRLAGLGGG